MTSFIRNYSTSVMNFFIPPPLPQKISKPPVEKFSVRPINLNLSLLQQEEKHNFESDELESSLIKAFHQKHEENIEGIVSLALRFFFRNEKLQNKEKDSVWNNALRNLFNAKIKEAIDCARLNEFFFKITEDKELRGIFKLDFLIDYLESHLILKSRVKASYKVIDTVSLQHMALLKQYVTFIKTYESEIKTCESEIKTYESEIKEIRAGKFHHQIVDILKKVAHRHFHPDETRIFKQGSVIGLDMFYYLALIDLNSIHIIQYTHASPFAFGGNSKILEAIYANIYGVKRVALKEAISSKKDKRSSLALSSMSREIRMLELLEKTCRGVKGIQPPPLVSYKILYGITAYAAEICETSLHDRIAKIEKRELPEQALRFALWLIYVLNELAKRKINHGDITLKNILVQANQEYLLSDWGSSRSLNTLENFELYCCTKYFTDESDYKFLEEMGKKQDYEEFMKRLLSMDLYAAAVCIYLFFSGNANHLEKPKIEILRAQGWSEEISKLVFDMLKPYEERPTIEKVWSRRNVFYNRPFV